MYLQLYRFDDFEYPRGNQRIPEDIVNIGAIGGKFTSSWD